MIVYSFRALNRLWSVMAWMKIGDVYGTDVEQQLLPMRVVHQIIQLIRSHFDSSVLLVVWHRIHSLITSK